MQSILNQPAQKEIRRKLRQQPITCERLLWNKLRNRALNGYKFRRQYSIGKYVVDFYCAEAKLAIEIDGATHAGEEEIKNDKKRQEYIETQGVKVIRFLNIDIKENMGAVLENIIEVCNERKG
jgi:very-short-patch-repair endonuclease